MSLVKEEEEEDVRGDEQNFVNCSSSKSTYMDENQDDSQEEEDTDSQESLIYTGENAKATLSDKLTYRLIKEYECRPCLWQKTYDGNKNISFTQKQKAFEDIAQALNLSSDLVKEKLRTLRSIFYQNVKKAGRKVGRGGTRFKPRWRFYQAMSFLQRADNENANNNAGTKPMQTQEILQTSNDNAKRETNSTAVFDPIVNMEDEECSDAGPSTEDDHQVVWCPRPESTSAVDDFGRYVSLTLAQIDDEIILKRAKCQIQLVLSAAITGLAKKNLSIMSSVNGKKFRN